MNPALQAQLDRLRATLAARVPRQPRDSLSVPAREPAVTPPTEVARRPASPPPPTFREAPLSPAEASARLTEPLRPGLSPTAHRLFCALHRAAEAVKRARGYHRNATHVTFFCPAEVVAAALGVHRTTVWRRLPELLALGLVDARAHKTTLRGRTVNGGTLWQVRLDPARGGRARLSYDELKHPWRDLEGDVEAGRTAFRTLKRAVQQSKKFLLEQLDVESILRWALPPPPNQSPLSLTVAHNAEGTRHAGLEALLDLPHASREGRRAAVDGAARAVAAALRDPGSLDFYRCLLWQLLRASDRGAGDFSHPLFLAVTRARVDAAENFARRPGALLVSRLKACGFWSEVWSTPRCRVAKA